MVEQSTSDGERKTVQEAPILFIQDKQEETFTLTKEVVVTTSVYQMILIMANHTHILTTCYMELSMRLIEAVNRLD